MSENPRQSLRGLGVSTDATAMKGLVGAHLEIHSAEYAESRKYGTGVRLIADVMDPTTGEITRRVVTSFGVPIVRLFRELMDPLDVSRYTFDPPLYVVVEQRGEAIVLEDVD